MARTERQLLVKIEQGGQTVQRRLRQGERLRVGQHPENDIILRGDKFPRKHDLFAGRNGHFQISLKGWMGGEVLAGESRLSFSDMIAHDLLPRRGDSFTYRVTTGKRGVVVVGDAKVTFQCAEVEREKARAAQQPRFIGYSWTYATFQELGRDLPFKVILLIMVVLHTLLLRYMSGLPTDLGPRQINRVPERLARIIVRSPESLSSTSAATAVTTAGQQEGEQESEAEPSGGQPDRPARPENMGVLGLLTGRGSSGQSNDLADFLLDKGLAKELDEVMSATDLSVGQGGQSDETDLDALFASGDVEDGIDDLLSSAENLESVSLGEKGQITVDRIGGMTGTQGGLGKRSEESVRAVMLSYTGRLTYIYNKYLKRDPDFAGKMVVEVVIAADGSVSDVKLVSSNMNNPEFEREILSFVRRWRYPAIDSGTVTVTYPLFFSKAG